MDISSVDTCTSGVIPRLGKQMTPLSLGKAVSVMAFSLNLMGEEKCAAIFIPVISVLVSKRLVHAVGTIQIESLS